MGRVRIDRIATPAGALMVADDRVVASRALIADGPIGRLIGMLGTPDPGDDEALVLVPCAAVHGVGLRARIGVAFVDRAGVVLRTVDPLPMRGARCPGAYAVIEAATGVLALRPGERVTVTGGAHFPHDGEFVRQAGGVPRRLVRSPVTGGIPPP